MLQSDISEVKANGLQVSVLAGRADSPNANLIEALKSETTFEMTIDSYPIFAVLCHKTRARTHL